MKAKSIAKACKITDDIVQSCIKKIKNFRTEKDIDKFLRKETRKKGCKIAFPPVVAIGKNAAEIHHKPNNSKLKKGFLVVDFGVKVNGFCSDMTRTIYLGKPSKEEINAYKTLKKVQEKCVKMCLPKKECFDIDSYARKSLGKLRELFSHSLGHGVGKKIHEKPNLSPKSADILKSGDIITIEPGIYLKGKYGIRIEDTILISKKSPKILTKTSKNLIIIK